MPPSREIRVRQARAADLPGVLALWEEARSGQASVPDRLEDLQPLLADSPAALLVAAAEDEEIVGSLIAAWDGWRGNLYRLAVRADCRRRGIGLMLIRSGEQRLRARGARRVTALVAFEDAEAGAFWDAAGYPRDEQIGRRARNLS
ncbi:MAG TPA: GNAT family N-acetyltransferase [Solirubrobacterales bacterium]|jgi:ribosomal protein S18 acetylase RimI-like enzyme|nr:GNAT family N-acetyltransferase [Solirubrobacterales bacterium]